MRETKQLAYTGNEDKPYDKFLLHGPDSMTDAELLAIIIRTGIKGEDAVAISKKVLQLSDKGQGILGLYQVSLQELMSIRGIGEVKAVKIKSIAELSKRLSRSRAQLTLQMDKPATVADYYMESLRHMQTEHIILVLLDNKNRMIDDCVISQGTSNASLLSPREIFLTALKNKAVYILLLHNHPSGDPTPSKQDLAITKRVSETAELIGIPLLDHIIIGDNKYISFKETGLL
ncbi:MAG: DNA repair protein RadC [Lachnospiraceae bacterium]